MSKLDFASRLKNEFPIIFGKLRDKLSTSGDIDKDNILDMAIMDMAINIMQPIAMINFFDDLGVYISIVYLGNNAWHYFVDGEFKVNATKEYSSRSEALEAAVFMVLEQLEKDLELVSNE